MKTCPYCSTINSDDATNCGVCGAGLSSSDSIPLEAAESLAKDQLANQNSPVLAQSNSGKTALVGVFAGIGLTLTGVILFPLVSSVWPIFLIIPGAILILTALDSLSGAGLRPLRATSTGGTSIKRDAEREEAEEEKLESGEAD